MDRYAIATMDPRLITLRKLVQWKAVVEEPVLPDRCIIYGPRRSGKTMTIIEDIHKELKRNPHITVSVIGCNHNITQNLLYKLKGHKRVKCFSSNERHVYSQDSIIYIDEWDHIRADSWDHLISLAYLNKKKVVLTGETEYTPGNTDDICWEILHLTGNKKWHDVPMNFA